MRAGGFVLLTALAVCMATTASAEWAVTPYLGINLAGDAEFRRGGPGGSIGYFGDRLGVELDFMRYNHFFKDEKVELVPNNCRPSLPPGTQCVDLNTDATGFMGNLVVPLRGRQAKWRPDVTAGLGVIHAWVEGPGDQYDVEQDNLAVNVGGGMTYAFNARVGLRGDLRYFHAFVDESKREGGYFQDYGFLRATVGVTVSFARR